MIDRIRVSSGGQRNDLAHVVFQCCNGLRVDLNETNPANAEFGAFVPEPRRPSAGATHYVIARHGLRLRAGPSTEFDVVTVMPYATRVVVLEREGPWAKIDLVGDGRVDGFAHTGFLQPIA